LFLTFKAINMSKNRIDNLINAALWLPMAGGQKTHPIYEWVKTVALKFIVYDY